MYERIMIVVDERPSSQAAIDEGTTLAAKHGAEVVYLARMPAYRAAMARGGRLGAVEPEEFRKSALARADEMLSGAVSAALRAGVAARKIHGPEGGDARRVVEAAQRRHCDLIVVGSEGRNTIMQMLSGSLVPGLITVSQVPVLVCKVPKVLRKATN